METIEYSDIRDRLKTGDIVTFSGKGDVSNLIKMFTRSDRSHIGMIDRSQSRNKIDLWESTTLSDIPDSNTGKLVKGVMTVPFSQRLRYYDGEVFLRQLSAPLTADMIQKFYEFRSEVDGLPYEENKFNLLLSLVDSLNFKEDLSSLFCSEVVSEFFQRIELLPEVDQGGKPSDAYTPADYAEGAGLRLLHGYDWLPEVKLVI